MNLNPNLLRRLSPFSKLQYGTAKRGAVMPRMARQLETLESRIVLTAPEFTSQATDPLTENVLYAKLVQADDADGDPLVFSIAGTGADDHLFTIDPATGDILFIAAPDFENPGDADGDNVYEINVEVTDNIEAPVGQSLFLNLVDSDDETPVVVSGTVVNTFEGDTFVQFVSATDADAVSVLQFSLTGNGPDDFLFNIDQTTGEVTFAILTDFANPVDADQNNIYEFEVQVSDGTNSTTQLVAVTVDRVAAIPVLALNGGAALFKKGPNATEVAPNLTLTGDNLGGGTLVVSINKVNTGKKPADIFHLAPLELLGTATVAEVNGRLVMTVVLDPNATAGDVEAGLRGVLFFTAKKGLKFTTRNVKMQVIDNNLNASNVLTQTINVRKK